jgi:hypothetical protein
MVKSNYGILERKTRKQVSLSCHKRCKRNLVFRVEYGPLYLPLDRRRHVFNVERCQPHTTPIRASVYSDIPELNFHLWEKIYEALLQ